MSKSLLVSVGVSILLSMGCSAASPGETGTTEVAVGAERVVLISAFPVVRPAGGFGPDTLSTEGQSFTGYSHTYFCEATVTLRTEANPACTDGMQDCGKTFERVASQVLGRCAAAGERFSLAVHMLADGAPGGKRGYREDPLSGSCAAGFVLGRGTTHPIAVTFADTTACASLEASFVGRAVKLDLTLAVKSADEVTFVAARVVD